MESENNENPIQDKSKISKLAITSLALPIISPIILFLALLPNLNTSGSIIIILTSIIALITPILPLLAINFGIISLKKIKSSDGKLKGKIFSITGIILGFIISIFLITQIYFPALGKVKYILWRKTCENNMNVIAKAMLVYVNDHDQFPDLEKWCDILIEECNVPRDEFRCPMAEEGPCNYALNKNIAELGEATDPDIVVLFETQPGWNLIGGPETLTTEYHQGDGCNIVFLDGHIEFIYTRNLDKLKWKPSGQ